MSKAEQVQNAIKAIKDVCDLGLPGVSAIPCRADAGIKFDYEAAGIAFESEQFNCICEAINTVLVAHGCKIDCETLFDDIMEIWIAPPND